MNAPELTIRKGSVVQLTKVLAPWNTAAVQSVHNGFALIKRPYTEEAKSFVLFDEALIPIDQLALLRY